MFAAQVTNQQIEEHFNVKVINEFSAEDEKGRRKYLSDLRTQYAKEVNNKAKESKKAKQRPSLVKERVQDVFVELDRIFEGHNVLIRESQPGLDLEEIGLQVYVMVAPYGKYRMSMSSKIFSAEEMKEDFAHYRIAKKESNTDITVQSLEFDEMVEVIKQAIQLHKAAA